MLTETVVWECDLCHRTMEGELERLPIGRTLQCEAPPRGWSFISPEIWPGLEDQSGDLRLLCDKHKIEFAGEIPT